MCKSENDPRILQPGHRSDVATWLSRADGLLVPSEREGMPVGIMESLCMGVPVIGRNVRGTRELVADGENGLLLKNGNESTLEQALEKFESELNSWRNKRPDIQKISTKLDRRHFVEEMLSEYESGKSKLGTK